MPHALFIRPNALLHNPEFPRAQLFLNLDVRGDDNVLVRNSERRRRVRGGGRHAGGGGGDGGNRGVTPMFLVHTRPGGGTGLQLPKTRLFSQQIFLLLLETSFGIVAIPTRIALR